MSSFRDFNLNKQILLAIEESGYENPTPIQQKVIPLITAGHDIIGIAQTGTGKTAAFVLPLLMKLKYSQPNGPRAIIFAPTRELAQQIFEHVQKFTTYTDLKSVLVVGGASIKLQRENLDAGADLIVATPGRFMDLYHEQRFGIKQIKTLVLDEADKMMDMGFMPQLRKILEVIPRKRQNLLFSATMAEKVETLSQEFLEFPERVEIAPQASVVDTIDQILFHVPNFRTKINLLAHLIAEDKYDRTIIFAKTKAIANNIFKFISRKHTDSVRVIHGNKDQNSRINAMRDFKDGAIKLLVATDVVARGIDIADVSLVVNFEVPNVYEDYVHRIGRTGRNLKSGIAMTFASPAELYHVEKIEGIINQSIPVQTLPENIEITKTSKEEMQEINRQIDYQRRKEDPEFKGAFHEKKVRSTKPAAQKTKGKRK